MAKYGDRLRQEQQQKLQQRLNPQNVALGRLLEMSVPEFEDEVRRELDDNPALEVIEPAAPATDEYAETSDQLQRADYADADDVPAYLRRANNRSADDTSFDAVSIAADEGQSMGEVLMLRLADENDLSDTDIRIAAHIIGNLDDNGYMRRPVEALADDMAMIEGFYVEPDDVRRVFEAVRSLDPPGIGATDLRDCLLLQLDRRPNSVTVRIAKEILTDYFDYFSKKYFDRIGNQLGIGRKEMTEALDLIRSLNPKPASALDTDRAVVRAGAVTPDFILDYDSSTDTCTLSLPGNIPELALEQSFSPDKENETTGAGAQSAKAFIRSKRNDALSFIRLVNQRRQTLMDIGKAIVQFQKTFMATGDKADIRPMILKDIAAITNLDISVISRATSGKYILTPHGLYPLKMFFNERPAADNDISAHAILKKLASFIAGEDKRHPLSDQTLRDMLAAAGFDIARRTVAKYREKLGIPVARLRRNF